MKLISKIVFEKDLIIDETYMQKAFIRYCNDIKLDIVVEDMTISAKASNVNINKVFKTFVIKSIEKGYKWLAMACVLNDFDITKITKAVENYHDFQIASDKCTPCDLYDERHIVICNCNGLFIRYEIWEKDDKVKLTKYVSCCDNDYCVALDNYGSLTIE